MEKRAKSSGISFHLELDAQLPPLLSDPSQLQQVFVNLIANAIDAHDGKPYGTIQITTRQDPKHSGIELLIGDTGSGIPPEAIERIFDPFFTTKPVGKGTGLGLSISYSIIKNLGGEIRVQSSVGKGTEFTVFLPSLSPEEFTSSSERRKVLR
jgi:two-component system, NtrC family, sensor kinase